MPTILSAVCNPTFHNIYIVLYASECGVRLDTDYILPRFDVFAETRPLLIADMNREEALYPSWTKGILGNQKVSFIQWLESQEV